MAETKINASQTTITASDIGAAGAVTVLPVASASEEGKIYQFTGTTDANYTNGYFYKCVATAAEATASQTYGSGLTDISVTNIGTFASAFETGFGTSVFDTTVEFEYDGAAWMVSTEIEGQTESLFDQDITDWAVTFTGTPQEGDTISVVYTGASYSWTRVDVQPAPVIPDPLPSQTGHANDVLVSDGTNASWSRTVRYFIYTKPSGQTQYTIALLGYDGSGISIVYNNNGYGFGCGTWQWYHMGANGFYNENDFPLGTSSFHWKKAYINVLNNGSDITVPNTTGEMAVKSVNTTVTLVAADWSSNTQTVSVTGVTATGVVFVSPDPSDQADYTDAGIYCSAQAAGTLTFTCDTTPSNDIDVVVVQL